MVSWSRCTLGMFGLLFGWLSSLLKSRRRLQAENVILRHWVICVGGHQGAAADAPTCAQNCARQGRGRSTEPGLGVSAGTVGPARSGAPGRRPISLTDRSPRLSPAPAELSLVWSRP